MNETETKTIADRIIHLQPCQDALDWAIGYTDPEKAWQECERGDWMLWLLGRFSGPPLGEGRRKLVLASCLCARQALAFVKDPTALAWIEAAEGWAVGSVSSLSLKRARAADAATYAADAADAAAYTAYTAYAAYAAYAATHAAYAAYAAAYAAAYTTDAAADAAADAAKARSFSLSADNIRFVYPDPQHLSCI